MAESFDKTSSFYPELEDTDVSSIPEKYEDLANEKVEEIAPRNDLVNPIPSSKADYFINFINAANNCAIERPYNSSSEGVSNLDFSKEGVAIDESKNSPMETSQLFLQDKNEFFVSINIARHKVAYEISQKRRLTEIKSCLQPSKSSKMISVLAENGINYEEPLTPMQIAANCAERIAREKQKTMPTMLNYLEGRKNSPQNSLCDCKDLPLISDFAEYDERPVTPIEPIFYTQDVQEICSGKFKGSRIKMDTCTPRVKFSNKRKRNSYTLPFIFMTKEEYEDFIKKLPYPVADD